LRNTNRDTERARTTRTFGGHDRGSRGGR
jgi:hypothetical protein